MTQNKFSPFLEVPSIVVEQRMETCRCSCNINFSDPCVSCPKKRWGSFFCYETPNEPVKEESFPKISEQAANFFDAAKNELKSIVAGESKISEQEKEQRCSICEKCEFFHAATKRCQKCGCYLKWKTAWRSQKCPIGKW
jgi:hypothetical protein